MTADPQPAVLPPGSTAPGLTAVPRYPDTPETTRSHSELVRTLAEFRASHPLYRLEKP